MVRAINLMLVVAVAGTLLGGCGPGVDRQDCVPYTTSEYQRRGDAVTRATHAKQRYDRTVYENEEVERIAANGDTRAINILDNVRRALPLARAELDRRNAELDRVQNEPPLCPSPGEAIS